VERAPSVHRARSQMRAEVIEKKEVQPRSISVNYRGRRDSSPVRIVERRDDRVDAAEVVSGQVMLAERPRRNDRDLLAEIRALEDERRLQLEWRDRDYNAEIIRDTSIVDSDGNREEIVEIRKDRKGKKNMARPVRAPGIHSRDELTRFGSAKPTNSSCHDGHPHLTQQPGFEPTIGCLGHDVRCYPFNHYSVNDFSFLFSFLFPFSPLSLACHYPMHIIT
jgi:hypothetical protein